MSTAGNVENPNSSISSVKERLKNLEGLPPFPAIATQILTLCESDDVNIASLVGLIECEPAIATMVLNLSNSPLYGVARPITTIGHSVVVLGLQSVARLAVSIAMKDVFVAGDPALADKRSLTFMRSIACATCAKAISTQTGIADPGEAFLGGVMHDVGKLVLFHVEPASYCDILESNANGNSTVDEINAFGIDHPGVGKLCGKRWGVPPAINSAIKNHHSPIREISHDLSRLIVLANYVARKWQVGFDEEVEPVVNDSIEEALVGMPLADIEDQCRDQFEAVREICSL